MAKKKCCGKNCLNGLCIPVWIVMLTGIALGVVILLLSCEIYLEIKHNDFHFALYILTLTAIFLVVFMCIVFLVLIKIPAICGMCGCFKNVWIIVHIIFLGIVAILIYTRSAHTIDELDKNLHSTKSISAGENGSLTPWFLEFQKSANCCGVQSSFDYGTTIFPETLVENCPPGSIKPNTTMDNSTSTPPTTTPTTPSLNSSNMTTISPENSTESPNRTYGCGVELQKVYAKCTYDSYVFVLVMLVLGVIPFICYTLVYQSARNEQKKEEAEAEAEEAAEEANQNDANENTQKVDQKASKDKVSRVPSRIRSTPNISATPSGYLNSKLPAVANKPNLGHHKAISLVIHI